MSNKALIAKVSLPYAEALLEIAQKSNNLSKINEDLNMIRKVLSDSDNLNIFFSNPLISQLSKKEVITQLFSGQVSDTILTFLLVLVDRARIAYLDSILLKYLELAYSLESLLIAKVISSNSFTDEQHDQLVDKLKTMTGNTQVKLELSVDPDLIGGFILQVGSKVIDTSLRGQLKEIAYFLEVGTL